MSAAATNAKPDRRKLIGTLAALPLIGAATQPLAAASDAGAQAIMRQIAEAERRCQVASKAFTDATTAFEAARPALPRCLDFTDARPRPRFAVIERRAYDEAPVSRGAVLYSIQQHRWIATVATLTDHLEAEAALYGHRARRRLVRRLRRRAQRYEAAIVRAEDAHSLEAKAAEHEAAQRALSDLGAAVYAEPALTPLAVQVQARMLCAYVSAHGCRDITAIATAARWGERLAAGVILGARA